MLSPVSFRPAPSSAASAVGLLWLTVTLPLLWPASSAAKPAGGFQLTGEYKATGTHTIPSANQAHPFTWNLNTAKQSFSIQYGDYTFIVRGNEARALTRGGPFTAVINERPMPFWFKPLVRKHVHDPATDTTCYQVEMSFDLLQRTLAAVEYYGPVALQNWRVDGWMGTIDGHGVQILSDPDRGFLRQYYYMRQWGPENQDVNPVVGYMEPDRVEMGAPDDKVFEFPLPCNKL